MRTYFYRSSAAAWVVIWAWVSAATFVQEGEYIRSAWRLDHETLQSQWSAYDQTTEDYYEILKALDRMLPPLEEITLILPQEDVTKFKYLQEKGRYILYPRNYGDNRVLKEYLLVYGVSGLSLPQGYETAKRFAEDKYLLKRTGR